MSVLSYKSYTCALYFGKKNYFPDFPGITKTFSLELGNIFAANFQEQELVFLPVRSFDVGITQFYELKTLEKHCRLKTTYIHTIIPGVLKKSENPSLGISQIL